jgi:hypothetical protein
MKAKRKCLSLFVWYILQIRACVLTSVAPIEFWHPLIHSSRSLAAKHELAARGRPEGDTIRKRRHNLSLCGLCVDPGYLLNGCYKPNWKIHDDLCPVPTSQRLEKITTCSPSQSLNLLISLLAQFKVWTTKLMWD